MVTAILYDRIKSAAVHLKEQEQLPGGLASAIFFNHQCPPPRHIQISKEVDQVVRACGDILLNQFSSTAEKI